MILLRVYCEFVSALLPWKSSKRKKQPHISLLTWSLERVNCSSHKVSFYVCELHLLTFFSSYNMSQVIKLLSFHIILLLFYLFYFCISFNNFVCFCALPYFDTKSLDVSNKFKFIKVFCSVVYKYLQKEIKWFKMFNNLLQCRFFLFFKEVFITFTATNVKKFFSS